MKTKTTKPQDAHTPDDIPFTIHMEPRTAEQIKHERLIAAAPDLLAALEYLLGQIDFQRELGHCTSLGGVAVSDARAAIAAAKGA